MDLDPWMGGRRGGLGMKGWRVGVMDGWHGECVGEGESRDRWPWSIGEPVLPSPPLTWEQLSTICPGHSRIHRDLSLRA